MTGGVKKRRIIKGRKTGVVCTHYVLTQCVYVIMCFEYHSSVQSVVFGCLWYRRYVSSRNIDTSLYCVVRRSISRVWITLICDSSLVITSLNRSYSGKLDAEGLKVEVRAVPVRAMTAYKGSRGIAPLFLNPGTQTG